MGDHVRGYGSPPLCMIGETLARLIQSHRSFFLTWKCYLGTVFLELHSVWFWYREVWAGIFRFLNPQGLRQIMI